MSCCIEWGLFLWNFCNVEVSLQEGKGERLREGGGGKRDVALFKYKSSTFTVKPTPTSYFQLLARMNLGV